MKLIAKLIFLAFLITLLCGSYWQKKTAGTFSSLLEVIVGDGRNDGVQRVYTTSVEGHLIEWTYINESWQMEVAGRALGGDNRLLSIWIGDAKNEGLNNVYCASGNGNVYEFSYYDNEWQTEIIAQSENGGFAGITIGDTQNNNSNKIIVGGWNTHCLEYSYDFSEWDYSYVSSEMWYSFPMVTGQARNDGINRIYSPDWTNTRIIEYTWNPTYYSYTENFIEVPVTINRVIIADGRDDGINRIYASSLDNHMYEFTFDNDSWSYIDIEPSDPYITKIGICFGTADPQGSNRLYSSAESGYFSEHKWNGETWESDEIDLITGATADLTTGCGRNDDRVRVYIASSNGSLYEYTSLDTSNTATISGYISSNNPNIDLTQATVEINNNFASPDDNGFYNVLSYEGDYQISVNLENHSNEIMDLHLLPGDNLNLNFELQYIAPPQNLAYTIEGNNITLEWQLENVNDPTFDNCKIYRKINDSNWINVGNVTETIFITNMVETLNYSFYVTAVFGGIESSQSNTINVTLTESNDLIIPASDVIAIANYPNPFKPLENSRSNKISFEVKLNKPEPINIEIYNQLGQKVKEINKQNTDSCNLIINWDGKDKNGKSLATGVYLYQISGQSFQKTQKLIILN